MAQTLAKELTRSKKAVERLYASKATMNSVVMQLQHQMAMMKMTKTIQKSTDVMKMMGNLVKLPEIRGAMMEMQQEMMKAGMIEEMLDDAINADDDELEEETDAEVDKVLFEVTNGASLHVFFSLFVGVPHYVYSLGVMGAAPNVPSTNVKGKGKEPAVADDEEDDMEAMQARLAALSED